MRVSGSPTPNAGRKRAKNDPADPAETATRQLRELQTPLRFIRGVGPTRAEQLGRLGLKSVEDLLYHLPFRYEDRRLVKRCRDAVPGETATFVGRLAGLRKRFDPRRRAQLISAALVDDSGAVSLFWYRAPAYLAAALAEGRRLAVHGRVEQGPGGEKRLVHPEFEALDEGADEPLERIVPVYVRPGGVALNLMRRWVARALADYGDRLPDSLPPATLERRGLLAVRDALARLHRPDRDADADELNRFSSRAHRSVVFDELLYLQLGLGLRKRLRRTGDAVPLGKPARSYAAEMRRLLPFRLTVAQERVLSEIDRDLQASHPMQRLVQGDVGSGKTMVAWLASLRVMERGAQAVWLAPTELLAEQHFRNLRPFAEALGLRAALVTGGLRGAERARLLGAVERGEIPFVVGTHAIIQEGVRAARMGLGVIDEQHRFGVLQRLSLRKLAGDAGSLSAPEPHLLLMSATPIPRSLAMVLYGDMDVSFLDQMPPGRRPVLTEVFGEEQRRAVYEAIVEELRRGHQAFVVYPLVEASDRLADVRDATRMAERMRAGAFRGFRVGLLHGRMSPEERDAVMRSFRDGTLQLLVCTTVVEVGIDVPNATVMVVEHADRFGLSQLHQLRGRVGRGGAPGRCLLINRAPGNPAAERRLKVMETEHDGFKIAEADLALRGPGEWLGTRQSGQGDFRTVNLVRDARLLLEAREEAEILLAADPGLEKPESAAIRAILMHRWGRRLELGAAG